MEVFFALGAVVVLDVAAYFFGADSRDLGWLSGRDRTRRSGSPGDADTRRDSLHGVERATRVNSIRF